MFSQRKNCRIEKLLCCSNVEVLVCKAVEKMFKCWRPKKKSAWTGLDQVDFENFFKESMFKLKKNRRGQV
jgi:hypothetical protein